MQFSAITLILCGWENKVGCDISMYPNHFSCATEKKRIFLWVLGKMAVQTNENESIWILFPCFFANLISLDRVASLASGYFIVIYDANLQKWKLFHVQSHLFVISIYIWIELCFVFFNQKIFLKIKFDYGFIGLLFSLKYFQLTCYLNSDIC